MPYKIVGICEGRSGDVEFLPEWAIGEPNSFSSLANANHVCASMQAHVDRVKAERVAASPGIGGSTGPAIKYMVLPALDSALLQQLHAHAAPAPAPVPTGPVLSFGTSPPSVPSAAPPP